MATPTLIQHVCGPTAGSTGGINSYVLQLPNPSLSGNLLIVTVTTGTSNTITVTDDKSNTYVTTGPSVTGNQFVKLFYVPNATAGVTKITASFSASQNFIQAVCSEFNNVATSTPADGTSTGSNTGTSVATGAIVTTGDGDLIYHVGWQDTGGATTSLTQGTSPWTFLTADIANSNIGALGVQYQVQTTHGSITPAFTMAPSQHFDTVAIAFKNAPGGSGSSPAAGIRVVNCYHATINGAVATPVKLQFPCTGNLLVAATLMIDAVTLSLPTDGNSNTWAWAGSALSFTGSGQLRIAYAANATTSTTMTGPNFAFSGVNTSGDTIVLYDVTGAATSPFDSTAGNPTSTGTDSTTTAHNINTASITPSTTNGLIISMVGVTNPGPVDTVSPGTIIACTSSPEASSGDMDENNGFGIEYNSTTANRTYSYHFPATVGGAGNWAAMAAAFKAPAAGAGIPFEDDSFNVILVQPVDPIISVW